MDNISITYLLFREFMIDLCLLGFGIVMHGFNSIELTS